MVKEINIFVFANLKASQIFYKIIPLSQSRHVKNVVILRKDYIDLKSGKIVCKSIPRIFQIRPLYWMFVPIYGIYLIYKFKIDILLNYNIFPHGFNAFFSSIITRKPVIFSEINEETMIYHSNRMIKPLIRKIVFNASHLTVTGSKNQSYWEDKGLKNIHRLHSTINVEVFRPDHSSIKEYDFIYIGEFDRNKRPDLILRSFANVIETGISAKICMIGFGELSQKLSEIVKFYKLQDYVLIIKTRNVLDYLQRSKIFLMASLSEGLPCALMESMACELISIVPKVGDIGDVVDDGENGFIYNGTEMDLTQKMIYVLENYNKLDKMRTAARKKIVDEHSYEVAINKWDILLEKVKL